MIPEEHIEDLVEHVVLVHGSVGEFSKQFLQKLRRSNYVTPKNYLDFISTYSKLLDEKTQFNLGEPGRTSSPTTQTLTLSVGGASEVTSWVGL